MTSTEILVTIFIGLGTAFCFLGALGLLRMPDFYSRMQATTKGTTLGVGLVMIGVALFFREGPAVTRAIALVLFLFATAPVGGHMVARAAYILGVPLWPGTKSDAMADAYGRHVADDDEDVVDYL
ncbi:MAG: monovalent cation/H(+) antiporter subunit G [Armatimonadetes bacterium]|nr:monovalent cation/H(+) antiporter subunit G [Armatimonadota bacterium]